METGEPGQSGLLAEALAAIPDPRRRHVRVHGLVPLLVLSVSAMLCGARSLYAIAQWGRERMADDPALRAALGFAPGRSPCVATRHRVFKRIDVAAFEAALGGWLAQTGVAPDDPVALDGKTLRGIHGEAIPGVHLVAVDATEAGVVLTQVAAPGKGQEMAAARTALTRVPLADRVVMADALHTQREVAAQIVAGGGDYLLVVKENQPQLRADLAEVFSPPAPGPRPGGTPPARSAGGPGVASR